MRKEYLLLGFYDENGMFAALLLLILVILVIQKSYEIWSLAMQILETLSVVFLVGTHLACYLLCKIWLLFKDAKQ